MSASHPTFESGHCFMVEVLNKTEVEMVGEILHNYLKMLKGSVEDCQYEEEDFILECKRVNTILKKMDHPFYEV